MIALMIYQLIVMLIFVDRSSTVNASNASRAWHV